LSKKKKTLPGADEKVGRDLYRFHVVQKGRGNNRKRF